MIKTSLTGSHMKVSSTKPESSNQISANTEVTSPSDVPADFFSDMIANLLAAPPIEINNEQESGSSDLPENEAESQSESEKPPITVSELILNFLNQPQVENKLADKNIVKDDMTKFSAADIFAKQQVSQFKQTDIDKNIDKNLMQQNQQILRQSETLAENLIQDEKINYPKNDNLNRLVSQLQEPVINKPVINTSEKYFKVNDKSAQQEQVVEDGINTVENRSRILNFNVNQEPSPSSSNIAVLNMQNGQVNYPDTYKNKYNDALVQMGGVINSHTSNLNNINLSSVNDASQTDYTDVLKNINRPEYELSVELLPQTQDAQGKEIYNATIKIHPPELGAVLAKLKVGKNGAELFISTENNRVKEIVEANLSQLRENFQKHDITVTQIHVEVQTPQAGTDGQHAKQQKPQESQERQEYVDKRSGAAAQEMKKRIDALVDTYA